MNFDIHQYLDEDQILPAKDIYSPCKIIAGPGSGKTRMMVGKYVHMIANEGIDPKKILFLTFGNKATEVIKDRSIYLLNSINFQYKIDDLNIYTIHGFSNKAILNNRKLLSRQYTPTSVLDEHSQVSFILTFIDKYANVRNKAAECKNIHKNIAQYFNKITDCYLDSNQIYSYLSEMLNKASKIYPNDLEGSIDISIGIRKIIENTALYDIYLEEMKKVGFTDFGNIQKFLLDELNINDELLKNLQRKYQYILIDEYQDTSFLQSKIIQLIAHPENYITVCGDDDQSLYRFRGATPNNFLDFNNQIPKDVSNYYLNTNYRSSNDIVDSSLSVISNNTIREKKELVSISPYKSHISYCESENEEIEAENISKTIQFLKDNEYIDNYSDVAILFRSVKNRSSHIVKALEKKNIPIDKFGFDMTSASFVGQSIIRLVAFISDKIDDIDNFDNPEEELLNTPNIFFDPENENYINFIKDLKNDYINDKSLIRARKYDEVRFRSNISIFYEIISNSKNFKKFCLNNNHSILKEIAVLSDVCKKFDASYRRTDLFLFHAILKDVDIKTDLLSNNDAVKLMTIHQAKGSEFPIVFMPSLIEPKKFSKKYKQNPSNLLIPLLKYESNDLDIIEDSDERKIFYVGMTRAKQALILSRPKKNIFSPYSGKKYKSERSTKINKYVKESNIEPIEWEEVISDFKINNIFIDSEVDEELEKINISFSKLRTYLECPNRYKFINEYKFSSVSYSDISFGLTLHRCLDVINSEYLISEKIYYEDDELKSILEKNWVEIAYRKKESNKLKDTALKIIKNYIDKNKDRFQEIKFAEKPFQVTNRDLIISGVIDLVREKDGKIELVDYKTRKINDSIYELQMSLYAYCYQFIENKIPEKLTLYSLSFNQEKTVVFNKEKFKDIQDRIKEVVSSIKNKKFDKNHCNDCYWCKISK